MSVRSTGVKETILDVESGEWPIRRTTVYNNQAEVVRNLRFVPAEPGLNLLILRGTASTVDYNSLRAEVTNARLLEVSNDVETITSTAEAALIERAAELQQELAVWQKKIKRCESKHYMMVQHQRAMKNSISGGIIESGQDIVDPIILKVMEESYAFYTEHKKTIRKEIDRYKVETSRIEEALRKLYIETDKQNFTKVVKVVKVLIEVDERLMTLKDKGVDIDLIYLARGAYWSASYDIRIEKGINEQEDKAILSYYAEVINGTAENWVEVEMSLSTAKPAVGGELPPLPRRQVDFMRGYNTAPHMRRKQFDIVTSPSGPKYGMRPAFLASVEAVGGSRPEKNFTARVTPGDAGSTLFQVKRLANVKCDGNSRRQTIGIFTLDSQLLHAASPKVSKDVYMKLESRNISDYPFLQGPMSVFVDGNFLCTSNLDLVRPNETFSLFLGVDDSVKISYAPEVKKVKTKKKKTTETISREILIINNSQGVINCCIYEQLPMSKDGKIKVNLLKPDMKKKLNGVTNIVNPFNHLETKTKVEIGDTFAMTFEYSVEWPEDEQVKKSYSNRPVSLKA